MNLHSILSRHWLLVMVAALSISAFAVACGDDDDDNGDSEPTSAATQPSGNGGNGAGDGTVLDIDYGALDGEIRVDGSSTVYPIAQAMAEDFSGVSDARVNVGVSGTGGGFERFCRGETQISNASRPIKGDEVTACADNGITDIVELQVAIDALTVVVNPENDFAQCMTVQQLHDTFKSGGAEKWSDIDPSWPDEQIKFFFPGADSGTFDYFNEAIIDGVEEGVGHRPPGKNATASEDDNLLAQGVESDRNAIGYFGFAYYQEAGSELNAVAIDDGNGCVEPTYDAALDGTYTPLSRPLFIYTSEELLSTNPTVLGFVNFYYEMLDDIVPEVGYIALPEEVKSQEIAKYEQFAR